jgi:superfamily I DNA/RNA helicase
VVLGTAGSGKTTMAMLRALFLADPRAAHAGRTLLVTFNRSLLAYLRQIVTDDGDRLHVRNYHHFARGYLWNRNQLPPNCILDDPPRRRMIEAAIAAANRQSNDPVLQRDPGWFVQELKWISQYGIGALDQYVEAERVGRAVSLDTSSRPAVWAVRDEYIRLRRQAGLRYDWHDLATAVRCELATDPEPRYYRHVVIDEGQDFSPEMLRSLADAVGNDGSITFFGDVAQQIYGRGVSWRGAGLIVKKVWEFKRNYRNSPQIAALGLAISAMPYFAGQDDMVAPDEFADEGPPPTLVLFDSARSERAWAVEQAQALGRVASTAVLFRRAGDAESFAARCAGARSLDRHTPAWSNAPGIWVGTVHAAKGFEFQSVVLCGLTGDRWPDPEAIRADGVDEATAADGRLLYVAVTRARQNLLMTVPETRSELLPPQAELWLELRP